LNEREVIKELLQENLVEFISKTVLRGKVYQIAIALCRYDTLEQEKKLI